MLTRNQFSLLFIMCSIGGLLMYSIPDLFMWLYVIGVTPESLGILTSIFTVFLLATAVWLNGYIAQKRYENKIKRSRQIQEDLDNQETQKAVKVGDVINPSYSGFKFQRSGD